MDIQLESPRCKQSDWCRALSTTLWAQTGKVMVHSLFMIEAY